MSDLMTKTVRAIRQARLNSHPQSDFGWAEADAAIRTIALHLDPNAKPGKFYMGMTCAETVAASLLDLVAKKEAVPGGTPCHSAEHAMPETTPNGEQR